MMLNNSEQLTEADFYLHTNAICYNPTRDDYLGITTPWSKELPSDILDYHDTRLAPEYLQQEYLQESEIVSLDNFEFLFEEPSGDLTLGKQTDVASSTPAISTSTGSESCPEPQPAILSRDIDQFHGKVFVDPTGVNKLALSEKQGHAGEGISGLRTQLQASPSDQFSFTDYKGSNQDVLSINLKDEVHSDVSVVEQLLKLLDVVDSHTMDLEDRLADHFRDYLVPMKGDIAIVIKFGTETERPKALSEIRPAMVCIRKLTMKDTRFLYTNEDSSDNNVSYFNDKELSDAVTEIMEAETCSAVLPWLSEGLLDVFGEICKLLEYLCLGFFLGVQSMPI